MSEENTTTSDPVASEAGAPKTVSGSLVVITMFAFGLAATGALWVYWNEHLEPFRPLQQALMDEFQPQKVLVRVDGGQRKLHKGTPRVLRISLRTDPKAEIKLTEELIGKWAERCRALATENVDLTEFDTLVVLVRDGNYRSTAPPEVVEIALH